MTGLSVLYANQAMKDRGWADVPDRNKVSRLREGYWLRNVLPLATASSLRMQLFRVSLTSSGALSARKPRERTSLVQELLDFFNVPVHETFTSPVARVLVDAVEKGRA